MSLNIKDRILAALGHAPRNDYNEIDIRFYKACNNDGQHGMVVVSHRVQRLDHVAVPFLFPGMSEPPALTARVLRHRVGRSVAGLCRPPPAARNVWAESGQ